MSTAPAPLAVARIDDPSVSRALDFAALERVLGRQPALWLDLLAHFREHAAGQIRDLLAAVRTMEHGRVADLAHKLKSSSRSVGAQALGDLCARLEAASVNDATPRESALCDEIAVEFGKVAMAIESYVRGADDGGSRGP